MIWSNILITILVLFFCAHLWAAIREKTQKADKVRLISKTTGQVLEIQANQISDFINKEILSDFTITAKAIFKCVAESFAEGRLAEIKRYLDDNVLPIFQETLAVRAQQQQKAEFTLIGFKEVKVLEDNPDKKVVSFTTEQVNLLRDKEGNVIEGDPLYVATVTEKWTFVAKNKDKWVVQSIQNMEAHFA